MENQEIISTLAALTKEVVSWFRAHTKPIVAVVDDSGNNAVLLQMVLSRFGLEPHIARDAVEFIALSRAVHFDLIFVDLDLGPGMGGSDLIKILETKVPRPMIIVVTGSENIGTFPRGHLLIPKGSNLDEMLNPIRDVLIGWQNAKLRENQNEA